MAIHETLAAFPVLTTVALRVFIAAAALWAYAAMAGLPVAHTARFWWNSFLVGFFNNTMTFVLIAWGQTHITSGLTGILNTSTAFFAALLAALAFPDERFDLIKLVGLCLGLAGVSAVVGPSALTDLDITSLAQLAVVGAGLSNAIGAILGRHVLSGVPPEVSAAATLTMAALVLCPAAVILEGLPEIPPPSALVALLYLALVPTAFGFLLYYRVLTKVGAGHTGLVTLLIAPIAAILGAIILNEELGLGALAGMALLSLGLLLIDGRILRWQQ